MKKSLRRKKSIGTLIVWLMSVMFAVVSTPALAQEIPRIKPEELKKMTPSKGGILVVDTQPKAVYERGHIL